MDYKKKKIFKKSLLLSSVILCILAVFLVLFILYINSLVKKETLGELSRLSKKSVSIINSNIENELNRTQSAANILSHCIGNTVELEASVDYIANANGYTSFQGEYPWEIYGRNGAGGCYRSDERHGRTSGFSPS